MFKKDEMKFLVRFERLDGTIDFKVFEYNPEGHKKAKLFSALNRVVHKK